MIDMASVYAARYKNNPDVLRAAVIGQSPDSRLDPYTALNALKLVNETNRMMMAGQAQQPTSAPSLVAQNMAPQAGLGAMVPGAMGQMGQAPQGMPPQGMPPQGMAPQGQAPVMQRSGGLAGMPTPEYEYAKGGIVAFQSGGSTEDDELGYLTGNKPELEETESEGSPNDQAKFNAYLMRQLKDMEGYQPKEMSDKDQTALYEKFLEREQKFAGPDIYKPAMGDLQARREAIPKNERYGQGLALLSAAGQILKGSTLAEGASNAAPTFAQQMAEVKRATMQEQRSIEQMQFSYADAQRKEKAGMHRAAQASVDSARKFQQDANTANFNKRKALADLAVKGAQANKPRAAGASGPKYQEQILQNNIDYFKSTLKPKQGETPEAFDARVRKQASDVTAAQLKTSFSTSDSGPGKLGAQQEALTSKENIEANKALDKYKLMNGREWRKAVEAAGSVEAAENQFKRKWITNNPQSVEGGAAPSAAPKPSAAPTPTTPKPTTTTKVVSMADVNATVTASGRTKQEVMDALKANGYTIK